MIRERGIPIFCQVMITIVLVEHDIPIRLQLKKKSNPAILAPQTPLVINRVTKPVDLAKKANPSMRSEEHEQELESM